MTDEIRPANFFVVGGTLRLEAPSYIRRAADEELLRLTLAGEYCNVLTARQMGKSSLMVQTADQLRAQGVRAVIIDLNSIGSKAVTASEWYFGLVSALAKQLNLVIEEQWWQAHVESGPVQRFGDFLREVVLEKVAESIVVFVDEIDSTLKQDFTDDFFAAIRAAYNARATDPVYRRITFVLLGVARPADLIKDRTRTPYNIGVNVDVTDFRFEELHSFCEVLEAVYPSHGEVSLKWVLDWTGGQPYLTQKISAEIVARQNSELTKKDVDAIAEQLFLTQIVPNDTNLRSIHDRVRTSPHARKMLRIYRNLLKGRQVVKEERSVAQNELKLAGLIRETPQGTLEVKNQLYAHVFDESWAKANAPIDRAVVIASVATAVAVLLLIALIVSLVNRQNQTALGIHLVQQGEDLYCIARAYKVNPIAIMQASGIPGPYGPPNDISKTLNPGQVLTIPAVPWYNIPDGPSCNLQFPLPAGWPGIILGVHTVQAGETLDCIGRAYKVNPAAIARVSGTTGNIIPGQKLNIPAEAWLNIPPGRTCAKQSTINLPAGW